MYRHILTFLIIVAFSTGPLANSVAAQENQTPYGKVEITSNPPKVMASAEEPLPKAKKSNGKYAIWAVLGVALVAMVAGGAGGGGGGDDNPAAKDTGSVEVEW